MKKKLRSIVVILAGLALFLASTAHSMPLPSEVVYDFCGTYSWGTDSGSGNKDIFGKAHFTLLSSEPLPGYLYAKMVEWDVTIKTYDNSLLASGHLSNQEIGFFSMHSVPSDVGSLSWTQNHWDPFVMGVPTDTISGHTWDAVGVMTFEGVSDWNFINNLNFLPSAMDIHLGNYQPSSNKGIISLDFNPCPAPVPEPTTILLLGGGLFALLGFRKYH